MNRDELTKAFGASAVSPLISYGWGGLKIRDYIAIKAMAGILAADVKDALSHQHVALYAYKQADAMLAEAGPVEVEES